MTSVTTTIRLDKDVKDKASLIANKLWINLSTVINLYLQHEFIVKQWVSVSLRNEYWFTPYAWEELNNELKNIDQKIWLSKSFDNSKELLSELKK